MGKKPKFHFQNRFPRYKEIQNYLIKLEKQYPKNVRLEKIGASLEGRPISMIVIQANQCTPKDSIMIEAGIHAREWLSNTTVLYIIQYVLRHQRVLQYMDFYVIPCINPDGYEYTHQCNRLWRKNMNRNDCEDEKCWGVDLNRNFSYGYGLNSGSSSSPRSLMYRGTHCLSEPEAQSLASALHDYGRYIKLYIAVHCYGNKILYPWGYTKRSIPDEKELINCAGKALSAMKTVFVESAFKAGSMSTAMYPSSGVTSDYARGVHKIKFSYTMELHKGKGKNPFIPRTSQILDVAKETLIGILAMVKYVSRYYDFKRKRHVTFSEKVTYYEYY